MSAEIEEVAKHSSNGFGTLIKSKKGKVILVGVVAVAGIALYVKSRAAASGSVASPNVAAAPADTSGASVGGSDGSGVSASDMQNVVQTFSDSLNASNDTMTKGLTALTDQAKTQATEMAALQTQINGALANEQSLMAQIGAMHATANTSPPQSPPANNNYTGGGTQPIYVHDAGQTVNVMAGFPSTTQPSDVSGSGNGGTVTWTNHLAGGGTTTEIYQSEPVGYHPTW